MPASNVCSTPGCGHITSAGRCRTCRREADRSRGTARQRGYNARHEKFRRAVLKRDPVCVLCKEQPSTDADHYPLSRRELVEQRKDPNDPKHGRGLCSGCHKSETAKRQPGGWNAQPKESE